MKTPDIPQECGLHEYGHNSGIWKGGGAYFDISLKGGRAALAAYCMAVIDEMIREVGETLEQFDLASDDFVFWWEVRAYLTWWKHQWSLYGGFTQ